MVVGNTGVIATRRSFNHDVATVQWLSHVKDLLTPPIFIKIIRGRFIGIDVFQAQTVSEERQKEMQTLQANQLNNPDISVADIYAPVQVHLLHVQDSLEQIVTPETEILAKTIASSVKGSGKMLRPLVTLLASGACGDVHQAHVEVSAVAELIHVATLLHDDVLDDADLRRGKPTTRSEWGNKVSILSGDYLLAQASLKLSHLDNCRLVAIFAKVLANLCEGEVEQIRSSYSLNVSWSSYFQKSICKTATLYAACCEAAGVLNQLPEHQIQALRLFGEKFGIAFQIIDDLLDYTSSAECLGKPVLDDLKNGLLNAPVLLTLEFFAQDPVQYERLQTLIEQVFEAPSDEIIRELFVFFDAAQAIPKTESLAESYARDAREMLAFLPPSPFQDALINLSHYVTKREY